MKRGVNPESPPIGWPGTVSLWRNRRLLVEFAYRHPRTQRHADAGWYAGELYAPSRSTGVDGDRRLIRWE